MSFNLTKKVEYMKQEGYSMREIQWKIWPEILAAAKTIRLGEVCKLFSCTPETLIKQEDVILTDYTIIPG